MQFLAKNYNKNDNESSSICIGQEQVCVDFGH